MSWETAVILDTVGITPKPLFVHTKKKLGFKYENFLITEAIEKHKKFHKFLKEEKNINRIKSVIKNLAIVIAKMHKLGIYHRDLTTGNLLVDNKLKIFIVDLNRAQNVGKLSIYKRLKDVSKIHFKDTEIFSQNNSINHFFNYYTEESGIKYDWAKEYWKNRKKLVNCRKRSKKIKNLFR
jgi:tRNA A-37 threonylcarbamoyl transferase component Bud32